MITIPFATDPNEPAWCPLFFQYQGPEYTLLGKLCTWQGPHNGRPQFYPEFRIQRLIGPILALDAFFEAFGNVLGTSPPTSLYYVGRVAVTQLERPLLQSYGLQVHSGDMGLYEDVQGVYIDGCVRSRRWFNTNVSSALAVPPGMVTAMTEDLRRVRHAANRNRDAQSRAVPRYYTAESERYAAPGGAVPDGLR